MPNLREKAFTWAEIADAWRVVPRVLVALYGVLVYSLYDWYKSLETIELKECDNVLLKTLTDLGMSVEQAYVMACQVIDVVGGPTTEQNIFVTGIIGLSTGIFAFYVNSGRRWDLKSAGQSRKELIESEARIKEQEKDIT